MKTKPNFTYKEFIQKISNLQIADKDKPQPKSPRTLKSQNKNVFTSHNIHDNRVLEKKSTRKQTSSGKNSPIKHSPRKIPAKQNILESRSKNQQRHVIGVKSTTNKKLKLKNQKNFKRESNQPSAGRQVNSIQQDQKGYFYHNQSSFVQQRHNQSSATFLKNCAYQNEEENFSHNSSKSLSKSPAMNSKMMNKKHSTSSIEGKLKIGCKGNLTERNVHRTNTQYYEEVKRPDQRLNTNYQRADSRRGRQSPSFYKLSFDESSFVEQEQDKTYQTLFPQSTTSRSKQSMVSLNLQPQKVKLNDKSHEHLYNKFICRISQILFRITRIQQQNSLLEHKIKYIEFLECLKELKMIKSDYEPYSQTQGTDIVKQLWEQLVMGHNISHFIIIVALILKVTALQQIKPESPAQIQNYIYIQKKYEQFRFTRLELDKSKLYSQKQSLQYYNFPFKPNISKNSQQIASLQKSQKKYKMNASVNHNQSAQLNSKRQNVSINTEFEFPNQSVSLRSTSPLGNKRSEILYKQAKKKSLQKRENKSTVDYEYEKNKQELTFKPKITIKKKKPKVDQTFQEYASPRFALDQEKVINRLIRGRIQKQVKQITIDRGLPYNDKVIQKLRRQKFEQVIKHQQQTRLKYCKNDSNTELRTSHLESKLKDEKSFSQRKQSDLISNNRCSTQVQQLQNIHNLSFQNEQNLQKDILQREESLMGKINSSPLKKPNLPNVDKDNSQDNGQNQNYLDEYFTLDIFFEEDRSDKLMIRRDFSFEEVIEQAERFVAKHSLSQQMGQKLKQELMIAMKFHDIEKIQENAQEEECSLLG